MHIVLVSQAYPPETARGGIGSQTFLKAHGLAKRGHQVHVIAHCGNSEPREYFDEDVLVTRIAGFERYLESQTEPVAWLTYSACVAAKLHQLKRECPFDIVDFPEWACEGYVYLLNRTSEHSAAAVIQLHGPLVMFAHELGWPEMHSAFYEVGFHMESMTLRLADAVYSSSRCSAEWCANHYGLDAAEIPVLHTGVDTGVFKPLSVPKASRPTVVFVGHIARNKGVDVLVQACVRLSSKFPDLCLRMCGPGEIGLIQELQDMAITGGAPQLLDLRGFVARQELPAHLSDAHVFAAPSRYEGGPGFVYLEAMACQLPVIGCAGSGASEAVIDNDTGLLVPPGDVESLADAIDRLLSDEAFRNRIARSGRDFVLQNSDSDACLDRLEAFYKHVVNSTQRQRISG